ncbi:hypothetical protein CF15_07130 [Pyrodictium occultum]|uniref:Uncharacterized protein n=1 Tax=Pyrodictium occultum TaxID=2309 RepID=A0A0V8RWQ3_PYROC|nr:hypothetical protein [Pyrodictium occultum]KSW12487.1 hypothetical protein CF15_07130 [Pyrodictium occultum]
MARVKHVAGVTVAVLEHGPTPLSPLGGMLSKLGEVYRRARPGEKPDYVELHLYPSILALAEALEGEALRAGAGVSAAYPVAYEAWTGIPRIHAVPGELASLPGGLSLLAHEAVHSILHQGPGYYIVRLPRGLPAHSGVLVAHAAATVVKDLEVHLWMAERGLAGDLGALRSYWLHSLPREAPCTRLTLAGDVLRAATAWIAEGLEPPLPQGCSSLAPLLGVLQSMAEGWRRGLRPWGQVDRLVEEMARLAADGTLTP